MADDNLGKKRRSVLKGMGAAAGASIFGFGNVTARDSEAAVSNDQVRRILRREETQSVIQRAGLSTARVERATAKEITLYNDTGVKLSSEEWLVIPYGDEKSVAYNPDERIAELETEAGTIVRATPEGDGLFLEELEIGDAATKETLETLTKNPDYETALDRANVASTKEFEAAAHRDRVSGTRRAFIPATQDDGNEITLFAEIDAEGELSSLYGFSAPTDIGPAGDPIECWAECITFGVVCMHVCNPCVSVPTIPTCSPCAVCIGGTASVCAVACGIEEFW